MTDPADILVYTEWIKLDSFLKFAGLADTGGEAKIMIIEGTIIVNGQVCMQRGRKLYNLDIVTIDGHSYRVRCVGESKG